VPDDFLTRLLNIKTEEGETLNDKQIEDQLVTFIGAGHETTSRAMTWMVYLLSQDDASCETLEKEIDALDVSLPPEDWHEHIPLAMACFEETMRLYPPAPIISRELIEADTYQDLALKKDSAVMINLWALHRHRKLWTHPDRFEPARFMPEKRESIHRFQYLPFGLGHRVCIGQRFAMQEAAILIALIFKDYRFKLSGAHPWPLMRITTKPETSLMMKVTKR
jgi:cytochrome P450